MKVKVEWAKLPRTPSGNMGLAEFETDHLLVEIKRADGTTENIAIRKNTSTIDITRARG